MWQLWRNCGFSAAAAVAVAESWLAICTNNYRNYLSLGCELNWNLNCIRLGRRDSVLSHIFHTLQLGKTFSHTHTHIHSRSRNKNQKHFYCLFFSIIYRTQKSDITREQRRALTFVRSLKLAQCKLPSRRGRGQRVYDKNEVRPGAASLATLCSTSIVHHS